MKIFDAMVLKRELGTGCNIEVKMLDTLKDGIVLSIEQNSVDQNTLVYLRDFVDQHKLSLLLDCECYFISTNALTAFTRSIWEN